MEKRKVGRPAKIKTDAADLSRGAQGIPPELKNFDDLPNSAHVRLPVVAGLYACSYSNIWRNVQKGAIPAPVKLTENVSAWNVGELRQALANRPSV